MTFPSPHPAAQIPIAPGTSQNSSARIVRTQQSAWGLPPPAPGVRRVLPPLSTDLDSSSLESSGPPASNIISPSPFTSTFSSVVNSSRNNGRASYSVTPASPFTSQAGSQQSHSSQILSPRSRTVTPSSSSHLASSAAASASATQGGGGSGGGGIKNQAFSPSLPQQTLSSPIVNTFDRSAFAGSNLASTNSGQPGVSKIVATQVYLLLGSITEKEGKAKWESQAEAIRKVSFIVKYLGLAENS